MWLISSWLSSFRKARPRTAERPRCGTFRPRLEVLEDRSLPSSGPLDPTFGTGGILAPPSGIGNVSTELIQPDGKLVVVGVANHIPIGHNKFTTGYGLVRYTASGALDPTFGTGGLATTVTKGTGPTAAALESDGKFVVMGGGGILRFNADGTLDTTFGTAGAVALPFFYDAALAIQADGKIVVDGYTAAKNANWAVARYNVNGTLDTTFGTGGKVITDVAGSDEGLFAIAVQADGKIVVGGQDSDPLVAHHYVFALGRYNPDGSLDSTFGTGGVVTTAIDTRVGGSLSGDNIRGLAIQSDGKIVAVGDGTKALAVPQSQWELARYNTNGSLDTTFGGGTGTVITDFGDNVSDNRANDVAIQADGKIVVAGWHNIRATQKSNFAVARYNLDGTLDTTFNGTGKATTELAGLVSAHVAIYPQAGTANDGKIVAVGKTGLVRYLSAAPQIVSFTANPNPVTAGSSTTLTASGVMDLNAGGTVSKVSFYRDSNGDGKLEVGTDTLLGTGAQNGSDWSFSFATTGLTAGAYTLFAQAQDSYGIVSDPLTVTLTVN